MAGQCCQLVGDLDLGINGCIISVNTNCNTEAVTACGEDYPLAGPTTGTISITAYADNQLWVGCPAKAGVNISYIRKYDCVNDIVYFIPSGQGQSFITGDIQGMASIKFPLSSCTALSASSTSGPASIYINDTTETGYGFVYGGSPISVETSKDMDPIDIGFGPPDLYLQSFNLEAQPGQFPTATYTFVFGGTFD